MVTRVEAKMSRRRLLKFTEREKRHTASTVGIVMHCELLPVHGLSCILPLKMSHGVVPSTAPHRVVLFLAPIQLLRLV